MVAIRFLITPTNVAVDECVFMCLVSVLEEEIKVYENTLNHFGQKFYFPDYFQSTWSKD